MYRCKMLKNLVPLVLLLLVCPHLAISDGYMTIKFIQYTSGGITATGKPCDEDEPRVTHNPCDPQFSLTAFRSHWDRRDNNLYHYEQKDHYSNQDDVHFGSMFGQIGNPVVIGMNYKDNLGQLWIEVRVMDIDSNGRAELMGLFSTVLHATVGDSVHLKLSNGSRSLTLTYTYTCGSNFYGSHCNTYCRNSDDDANGHRWCTSNGEKICLYGWVEPRTDCKKPHPCRTCVCQNGGTCVPQGEGFSCICAADYSGAKCENCEARAVTCDKNTKRKECGCDLYPYRPCTVAWTLQSLLVELLSRCLSVLSLPSILAAIGLPVGISRATLNH